MQAIYLGSSDPEERLFLDGSVGAERSAGSSEGFQGRASFGSGEQLFSSWEAAAEQAVAPSRLDALPSMDPYDSEGQVRSVEPSCVVHALKSQTVLGNKILLLTCLILLTRTGWP